MPSIGHPKYASPSTAFSMSMLQVGSALTRSLKSTMESTRLFVIQSRYDFGV